MFKSLKLTIKIPLIMLVLAILNTGVISCISLFFSTQGTEHQVEQKLEAVRTQTSSSIFEYFKFIKDDLLLNAESLTTHDALREFQSSWDQFGDINKTDYLQKNT